MVVTTGEGILLASSGCDRVDRVTDITTLAPYNAQDSTHEKDFLAPNVNRA